MPATRPPPPVAFRARPGTRRIGRGRALLTLAALVFASVVSLGMVAVRKFYVVGVLSEYRILPWNLLLAWIPMVCAFVAYRFHVRGDRPSVWLGACAVAWFLFFPNAPYIVTDFVHLQPRPPAPLWFDLLMIASFAWTGLCLGYLSLYLMQEIARARFGRWPSWLFVLVMLLSGSVGVYMGRILRWNSWEVLGNPHDLVQDGYRLFRQNGGGHSAVAFVGTAFLFLLSTYCATFALTHLHEEEAA